MNYKQVNDAPIVVSVKEAGRQLNLGRTTILRLLANGELPYRRVGRRILIPRRALERFLEGEK